MAPSQLPPPSPLRTGTVASPSPGSSSATTPTPIPQPFAIPPGLASPSFYNQQSNGMGTNRAASPFVPGQGQQQHKVSLSSSSTSSNGSSSYLSAVQPSSSSTGTGFPSSASNASSNADRSPPSPSFRNLQAAQAYGGGQQPQVGMLGPSPGIKVPGSVRTPGGSFLSSAEESVWAPPGSGKRTPLASGAMAGGLAAGGWGDEQSLPSMAQIQPPQAFGQPMQQQQVGPQGGEDDELDKLLRRSPLVNSIISRLLQTESSVAALASQLSTINHSLSSLVPGPGTDQSLALPAAHEGESESVKLLSSQVVALSTSVSQLQSLIATQQATSRVQPVGPQPSLPTPNVATPGGYQAPSNPAFNTAPLNQTFNLTLPTLKGPTSTTPGGGQQGPLSPQPIRSPGAAAFGPNGPFPTQPAPNDGGMRLNGNAPPPPQQQQTQQALRPGMGGRAFTSPFNGGSSSTEQALPSPGLARNGRPPHLGRMDSYDTTGGGGEQGWPAPSGPLTPGGSSLGPGTGHNMTKWDQVGLVPELLRGILKYGIGPPNKIQQRALPFLLKGSDIIAQAPPTQERIVAYVVPGINACLLNPAQGGYKGPQVVVVTTTVDQATQAYKVVRDLATPLNVRSSLCTGPANPNNTGWIDDQRSLAPTIVVGTPAKINELFAPDGRGLSGEHVRYLVIDEVDQLIARNLYEHVVEVVKRFPLPRNRGGGAAPGGNLMSPSVAASPYDTGAQSPFNPLSNNPFPGTRGRFPQQINNVGAIGAPVSSAANDGLPSTGIERQTCLFSNTVPQDVLNFSNAINVREPVRVLVRRDGGGAHVGGGQGQGHADPMTPSGGPPGGPGGGLKHLYLYLAIASSGASRAADGSAGTIGSGRAAVAGPESNQAREWKLEALADLLDDEATLPALVFVGSEGAMDAVVYKLSTKGLDAFFMHPGMNTQARMTSLNKFRTPNYQGRGRVLVIFDLHVKVADIGPQRLVINYDLPRSVEGYAQRVSTAMSNGHHPRPGVVVNLIQANGGDVEMLRSIECAYKFKCSEVPVNLREAL